MKRSMRPPGFNGYAHLVLAVLLLLLSFYGRAEKATSPERVLWNSRPIPVHIERGQERIIHFPDDVRYWLPDTIKNKVTVIAANGVLYIHALDDFPQTRIRVQGLADQQIYLLDVFADNSESLSDELVVMTASSVSNRAKAQSTVQSPVDWRVRLTRYAAQQLYAPERLVVADSQIKRMPLNEQRAVPLVRGQSIEATPIASWQGGGLTLTAVKLRNTTEQSLRLVFEGRVDLQVIDLAKALRGDWLTASCQHNTLGKQGSFEDTTTLYLLSKRSFAESLGFTFHATTESAEVDGG